MSFIGIFMGFFASLFEVLDIVMKQLDFKGFDLDFNEI